MRVNSGHFIADGSAVNVHVGFIPDLLICFEGLEETNPQIHYFLRELANTANGNGQYGILDTGGTKTKHAAATNGFATLDTVTAKVMITAPNGEGDLAADLPNEWTQARSTAATARTTTALGTIIKPTASNANGYVYECTTAGTGAATEPTWNTTIGGTTTDGTTIWTCRIGKVKMEGEKGFTLGATASTDTDEWAWIAFKFGKVSAEKDAASYDAV